MTLSRMQGGRRLLKEVLRVRASDSELLIPSYAYTGALQEGMALVDVEESCV